jgi:hypothetical protein
LLFFPGVHLLICCKWDINIVHVYVVRCDIFVYVYSFRKT